jgi:hypothetical protein
VVLVAACFTSIGRAALQYCCDADVLKWNGNNNLNPMYYNTVSFPPATNWSTRLIEAAQVWTDVPDSAFNISLTPSPDNSTALNNHKSELFFVQGSASTISCPNGTNGRQCTPQANAIAWTGTVYSQNVAACCDSCACVGTPVIQEADIIVFGHSFGTIINWVTTLPSGGAWDPPGSNASSNPQPGPFLLVTAVHEMGHAAGLQHEGNGQARMSYLDANGGWMYSGLNRVRPLGPDRRDLATLYPNAFTSYWELYVSNVTTASNDSGSSRPLSYRASTNTPDYYPQNLHPVAGHLPNYARRGDTVIVPNCIGNLGNLTGSATAATITGYLSPDRIQGNAGDVAVTSFDPTFTFGVIGRGKVCVEAQFTIPMNTANGNYWYIPTLNVGSQGVAVLDQVITVGP